MSPSLQEVHARLCCIEEQHDLLKYRVDGWSAWPIVRFDLSLLLTGIAFRHAASSSRTGRAFHALTDLPSFLRVKSARHVIKTYSSGLLEESGGRFRDIWFDDVMVAAGSVFKIEAPGGAQFSERSRLAIIPRDLSSTAVEAAAALVALASPAADVQNAARSFAEVVRNDLGLRTIDEAWVKWRLHRFSATRRVYRSILRRVSPTFVLIADPGEHALIAAAKEQRATVLELQHGIADASNASYGWPPTATRHKARMPIPDRLLLYGEHWKRGLQASGFWGDDLRVVGSPRLDRYRTVDHALDSTPCRILFTSQGLDIERTTAFLSQMLERAGQLFPVHLVVKLHPVYDVDKEPYLRTFGRYGDRVQVLASAEGRSTFELLQTAHVHVSISSASHYDALGLRVPSVTLPFQTHEVVLPLIQAGHAHLASTPDQLVDIARRWRELRVPADLSEYYFARNGRDNILKELAGGTAADTVHKR